VAEGADAQFLQVLRSHPEQDLAIDIIVAEKLGVLFETQAAQPRRHVHTVTLGSEERQTPNECTGADCEPSIFYEYQTILADFGSERVLRRSEGTDLLLVHQPVLPLALVVLADGGIQAVVGRRQTAIHVPTSVAAVSAN
jgi:hypothetical protein